MALTERQKRFAFEYVKDFNATRAYVRAGYSEQGANPSASKLLALPSIQEEIEAHKETISAVARLTPAFVLKIWLDIATCDRNELVSVDILACPKCYDAETREGLEAAGMKKSLQRPNPECPACMGAGLRVVNPKDSRYLSAAAKNVYAGAVQTKDGIKILTESRTEALLNIAKYLGMIVNKNELAGPGGGPIPLAATDPESLTDEQLLMIATAGHKALTDGTLGVDSGVSGKKEPVTLEGSV